MIVLFFFFPFLFNFQYLFADNVDVQTAQSDLEIPKSTQDCDGTEVIPKQKALSKAVSLKKLF